MGWFGPRGLASVVFTLLALQEIEHSGYGMLLQTVTWTILLSVVLHGISAPPLAARYGASIAKAGNIPEKAPASEPRVRLHDLAGRHSLRGQQARETTSTATGEPTAGTRPS
jgi:NhaP-type Na+/H+ or K+/H+ antiporter